MRNMFKKLGFGLLGLVGMMSQSIAASTNTIESVSSALETKVGLVVEKGVDTTVAMVIAGLVIFAVIFIVAQGRKGARAGAGR